MCCRKLKLCKHLREPGSLSVTVLVSVVLPVPTPTCCHVWLHMTKPIYKAVTVDHVDTDTICTWSTAGCFCWSLLKHFRSDKLFPLQKAGSYGPRRLVRVAFYMFFSNVFTPGESFSYCQMTTCNMVRDSHPLKPPLQTDSSSFLHLWSFTRVLYTLYCLLPVFPHGITSLSHYSLSCAGSKRARFTSSQCWACLQGRSECGGFV